VRWQRVLATIAAGVLVTGCASKVAAQDEVVLFEGSIEFARCSTRECVRQVYASFDREIVVYHAPGISGANDIYVPNAVAVLEQIVRDCRLGRALLSYHTDGVASLHVGETPLTDDQMACIRSYERPGLFLLETSS
jgi:hypothetical protein